MKILFLPHNAYHTRNLSLLAPTLREAGAEILFVCVDGAYADEGAGAEMRRLALSYVDYRDDLIERERPDVIAVMNDWGGVVSRTVVRANRLGVTTVSLVEGAQDFEDTHILHTGSGTPRHPYRRAKYCLLTGEFDRRFIGSRRARVVGVPRFDSLFGEEPRFPDPPVVAINCNFSYGIYTDVAADWVDGAVAACETAGLDYVITRHHADTTDLGQHPVAGESVLDVIRGCNVFVSRFSTCVLEAMILGKPVVYHNPHGERVAKFQDSLGAYEKTATTAELARALVRAIEGQREARARCEAFLRFHVSRDDRPAAERAARALLEVFEEEAALRATWRGRWWHPIRRRLMGPLGWAAPDHREASRT